MKPVARHIITGFCAALLLAGMTASVLAGHSARKPLLCNGLKVIVTDSLENDFVSKNDIKAYIDREYGKYQGAVLDSIDLTKIEDIISRRSAVRNCEAYVTRDGLLNIKVTQRKPVLRFQTSSGGFYADDEGCVFPLQRSYASHVQVIDGNIPLKANTGHKGAITDPQQKKWFDSVLALVLYIEGSREWKDNIVQIHVDKEGNLVLIPRDGQEKFIFGQPEGFEEKFGKMKRYYTAIIPEKGAAHYRKIDLRYKDQIICSK